MNCCRLFLFKLYKKHSINYILCDLVVILYIFHLRVNVIFEKQNVQPSISLKVNFTIKTLHDQNKFDHFTYKITTSKSKTNKFHKHFR